MILFVGVEYGEALGLDLIEVTTTSSYSLLRPVGVLT